MSGYPARSVDIVYAFMDIPYRHRYAYNWGTAPCEHRDEWHVNDETYINGIVLNIDGDYWGGYLLECVDRTSGVVTFVVVNTYYGAPEGGYPDHDFQTYEPTCGTFFDRTEAADHAVVCQWAVSRIYGMAESYFDDRAKERRDERPG